MSCSDKYTCVTKPLALSKCSSGFVIYIEEPIGSWLIASVSIIGGVTFCKNVKVECENIIHINWRPAEYITEGRIELKLRKPNGEDIAIKFGDNCEPQCGIELSISNDCNEGYLFLNKNCSENLTYKWIVPIFDCKWEVAINNCSWTLKDRDMVKYIKYDTMEYEINEHLLSNGIINQALVDKLNAIEDGAWNVSIVGTNVEINYNGTAMVDFVDNCKVLEKICQ